MSYDLPTRVKQCSECADHWFTEPFLREAFASVGIEHGKSTWEMAESYFQHYHGQHATKRRTRARSAGSAGDRP